MSYLVEQDYENFHSLILDLSDVAEKMPSYSQRFRAKSRIDNWVAPKASFYPSENYTGADVRIPDITTWALGNLVFNPKSFSIFKDLISSSGEFLPLLLEGETYYMLNTLFVVPDDSIDRSQSVDIIDSGVHLGQDRVNFDESQFQDKLVFKSSVNKLTFSFVTEQFKNIYDEYSLTGLTFKDISKS